MFEELVGTIFPGGAFLAAGIAIGAAFSKQLRPVAKEALKAGMRGANQMQQVAAEAYERTQDLVAEARYEQEQETRNGASAPRGGRTGTRRTRATSTASQN